jgi:Tfp pilus assembly protein PilO
MTEAGVRLAHVVRHPACVAGLVALIFTLAILALAAALVWRPARDAAAAADDRLDRIRVQLRELRARDKLMQSFAVRAKQAETLEAKLKQAKAEPAFVRDIEALANRSGATVEQVSSPSEEKGNAVNTALFEIILRGSYGNIRRFIGGLTELDEFVTVERVSLERDGEGVRAYLVLKRRHKAE